MHKITGRVFKTIYVTTCICGKTFITGNTHFTPLYESLTMHFLAAQEHLEKMHEERRQHFYDNYPFQMDDT